jgi:hypothetical protein
MSMELKNDRDGRSALSGVRQLFYVVHPFSQGRKADGGKFCSSKTWRLRLCGLPAHLLALMGLLMLVV